MRCCPEASLEEVGVATPVFDHGGELCAAVLVSAPKFRVSQEQLSSLGEAATDAARDISARLGGQGANR